MKKMPHAPIYLLSLILILGILSGCSPHAKDAKGPDIYDTHADGEQLIAEALATAQRERKRVLAEFGANWCIWCRRLHALLHTHPEIAPYFERNYLLVMIDVDEVNGKPHNLKLLERYGDPTTNGIPGLVLLDATGQVLKVQATDTFEQGDHYDPDKVLTFLRQNAPPPGH